MNWIPWVSSYVATMEVKILRFRDVWIVYMKKQKDSFWEIGTQPTNWKIMGFTTCAWTSPHNLSMRWLCTDFPKRIFLFLHVHYSNIAKSQHFHLHSRHAWTNSGNPIHILECQDYCNMLVAAWQLYCQCCTAMLLLCESSHLLHQMWWSPNALP